MQDAIASLFAQIPRLNALRRKNAQSPIVDLSVGEPFLNTHPGIIEDLNLFAHAAEDSFNFSYAQAYGSAACLQAICELYQTYYPKLKFDPDEVMLCHGATQAIWNALNILIQPGDEILLFEPYFSLYYAQIAALKGHAIKIATHAHHFVPSAMLLAQALEAHPEAKILILNYPNNPSGITLTDEQSLEIAEVLRGYPALAVIIDDVYRELSLTEHIGILDVMPELKTQCIVVNSASKGLMGTPGVRAGMVAAKAVWIKQMRKLQSLTISSMPTLTEYLLMSAIKNKLSVSQAYQNWITQTKATHATSLNYFVNGLDQLGFKTIVGGNSLFILSEARFLQAYSSSNRPLLTDQDIANFLLHEAGVACVRGSAFGVDASACFLRFSYAKPKVVLEQVLKNIAQAQQALMNEKDKRIK